MTLQNKWVLGSWIAHLGHLGPGFRRQHNEHNLCGIDLNLDQWPRMSCRFNILILYSSGGHFVPRSRMVCAIVVEGIM